jgi:hypothetical protein
MWPEALALRWSSIAASVVDLPAPVAPTIRIRPRFSMTSVLRTSGSRSESSDGITAAMWRTTAA